MKLLSFLLQESKLKLLMVAICGLISSAGMTLLMKTVHEAVALDPTQTTRLMWSLALAALLFVGGNLAANLPLYSLTESIVFRLRLQSIRQILAADLRHIEQVGSHRVYASLTDDIGRLANGLTSIPGAMINAAMLGGCVFYTVFLAPKIILVFVPFLALLGLLFRIVGRIADKRFHAARESGDDLFHHFKTVAEGFKELKLHGRRRHAFIENMVIPTASRFRDQRVRGLSSFEVANAFMGTGFFIVAAVLIFVFPVFGLVDRHSLAGLMMVFLFIYTPLSKLFDLSRSFSQANVSLRKMEKLRLQLESQPEASEPAAGARSFSRYALENVTHTYYNERQDEQFALGPISLEIRPGEILFITGGNGSGKSTLAKLITALYLPEGGQLSLDGQPVGPERLEQLRQLFSTVFSDFFLFQHFLGLEDPRLRQNAAHYLAALHLDHKVQVTEQGLSTTELSSGQRKRLALLVAYLEDRPIYLFDEWASDQDPIFKQIFYRELLPDLRKRGKAVIVISHDDRYFDAADRTIKLENGQIVSIDTLAPEPVAP